MSNSNVKKYIYCLKDNPINEPEVDVNLLETGHIVLTPFDENILDEKTYNYVCQSDRRQLKKATIK